MMMKKSKLSNERILKIVTASNNFEGLKPSKTSDNICKQFLDGKLSGEEAIRRIKHRHMVKS